MAPSLTGFCSSSYYYLPAEPTQEPQPAIYDPVLKITYPYDLTNPNTIPNENTDPVVYPPPAQNLSVAEQEAVIKQVIANVTSVIQAQTPADSCLKCKNALAAGKLAALLAPSLVPAAMISVCESVGGRSSSSCQGSFNATLFGAVWTQVLAFADVQSLDGDYICNSIGGFCHFPKTSPLNTTGLFPKPKPAHARVPKASGKRVKVVHLSDFHLDPRYSVNSEASCSSGLCCRANNPNTAAAVGQVFLPAPPYGSFKCDSPYDLGLAALQAIGPLTGTQNGKENGKQGKQGKHDAHRDDEESIAWTLYTGDLVSHDHNQELSRAYVEYTEASIFEMMKYYLTGPVFAALGNHDTSPQAIESPHTFTGPLGQQQSWNYDHVAGLWQKEGWINADTAAEARTHYGGYSVKTDYGLRIIAFNTGK